MSDTHLSDNDTGAIRAPACDLCRARKVRCDRRTPCSQCQTSRLQCHTTKKRPERRQRISVSGKYDKEIESVSERLAGLERLLGTFVNSQSDRSSPNTSTSDRGPYLSTPSDEHAVPNEVDYEGDSSFGALTKNVTQVIEGELQKHRLHSPSHREDIADVAAAVSTLRNFLHENGSSDGTGSVQPRGTFQEMVNYPELSSLELPPASKVLCLLRYAKTHDLKYLHDFPNLGLAYLTELCQKIYFPAEQFTIATFIMVHVSLLNIFRELSKHELRDLDMSASERDEVVATCLKNGETATRSLRLQMRPTFENIEALVQASTLAADNSHTSLAWTLITAAMRMAQDAGYHRLPSYKIAPNTTKKRRLFWFMYCVERGMALNLGRGSTIQDWDISTEHPNYPDELEGLWGSMFSSWFDFAKLQGDLYNELYCVRAQREPVEVKSEKARSLASRMTIIMNRFNHNDYGNFERRSATDQVGLTLKESLIAIKIIQNCTLCLTYRVIPPNPAADGRPLHPLKFCEEAIQTAREALKLHNEAWRLIGQRSKDEWRVFVHWTLHWCPFIPYIVLFGNVIADHNKEDFELLENCVDTLDSAAQLSQSVNKLHRVCRIFHKLAKDYLRRDQSDQRDTVVDDRRRPAHQSADIGTPLQKSAASDAFILPILSPEVTQWGGQGNPFLFPTQSDDQQVPTMNFNDIDLPDFPLSHEDWNGIFNDSDLGLGADNAREMSAFFGQYLVGSSGHANANPASNTYSGNDHQEGAQASGLGNQGTPSQKHSVFAWH